MLGRPNCGPGLLAGIAAQTGGSTSGKSHCLATVLKAYDGRSAIEVTVEPSTCKTGESGSEILDEGWAERASG